MILGRVNGVDTDGICLELLHKRDITSTTRRVGQWIGVGTIGVGGGGAVACEILYYQLESIICCDLDVLTLIGYAFNEARARLSAPRPGSSNSP